jgi:arylsulfatase A-like enzyme/Flp pilus assembly protein TadD
MEAQRRLLGALLFVAAAALPSDAGAEPPSVLLVSIDTLRADHVGAYGAAGARTPTLDRLAAEGVRFENAIATSPLTLPSHASLLTGLRPPRHGVRHNGLFHLGEEATTLAERFRDAGRATGAVVGAYVLAARFGLAQGFGTYDDRMSAERAVAGGYLERRAAAVTDRALEWLAATPGPFFLWVHYYDPHADYAPPGPYATEFRERPYDGEIAYVDRELGRLLAGLEQAGRLPRTLVALTADHGESLGEHGEATHGYGLYDATLRVPLLVRGPGVPAGRVVGGVVSGVDVAPTLLALAGAAPLTDADGRDLAPLWREGAPPSSQVAYAESLATEIDQGWSPVFAVRSRTHHYVRAPRPELYDVAADPKQLRDLLAPAPGGAAQPAVPGAAEIAAPLDAEIAAALERETSRSPAALDAGTRRNLEALGYALPAAPVAKSGLDPKDGLRWTGHYLRALGAFEAERPAEARALLEELLAATPESRLGHALLARVHVAEGRPDRALAHAEAAARLVPASAEYQSLLGDVRLMLGDAPGAGAAYRGAAGCDRSDPFAQTALQWLALQAGDPVTAAHHAERAAALDPTSAEVRERIASVWERGGEYPRALDAYGEALRLAPDSARVQMALAIQTARLGRESESAAHLARAGALAEAPAWKNRLGIVHAARGDLARAEAIFREILARHPGYPSARANLARVQQQRAKR